MYIKKFSGFSVFQVEGSLAALMDERVWECLLRGEMVLVMEPDVERWTLFKNGEPVRTVKAATMDIACQKFVELRKDFAVAATLILDEKTPLDQWELRAGYPNYLSVSPEQAQMHARAGRDDAKKIAEHYRELIEQNTRGMIAAEEIYRFGIKREGKT
jgi:hypothetical protein